MSLRRQVWLSFIGVVVLAALAGVVVFPSGPDLALGSLQKELKIHLGLDLKGGASLVYEAKMDELAEADRGQALEGVRDVIERRINAFGVSEPVIQTNKVGEHFRVIVELPGVTDIDEAINRIGETPLLEFREQKEASEEQRKAIEALNEESNKKADEVLEKAKAESVDFAALANEYSQDPGNEDPETGEKKGGDLDFFARGVMVPEFEEAAFKTASGDVVPDLVETSFGYHVMKVTEKRGEGETEEVRASHILFRKQMLNASSFENTPLSGSHLKNASVTFDPNSGTPQVSLIFNDEGATLFEQITERNINKPVGIYLDGEPISVPTVNQKISGGQAVITGDFTLEDSKQLARRLNAGALPVPVELLSQEKIGPTLGRAAIERSFVAGLLGLILVALFMIAVYRLPGVAAVVSLGIYALLTLSIFKLWPVTLTLAGIAGFILSIGMAVDANVLIFERLKEELRQGKPLAAAIEDGFQRAWLSIRDSNISSLITCLILLWFGSSVVKGFAVTLALGILVSMFSAITMTRTFLRLIASTRLEKYSRLFGRYL